MLQIAVILYLPPDVLATLTPGSYMGGSNTHCKCVIPSKAIQTKYLECLTYKSNGKQDPTSSCNMFAGSGPARRLPFPLEKKLF